MSVTVVVAFQAKPDQVEPLLAFLSGGTGSRHPSRLPWHLAPARPG